MNLGEKIRDIRKQKGLTQAQLAKNSITRNMLSQIETGRAIPSIPTLLHIAKTLDVPIEFLISDKDDISYFTNKKIISELKTAFLQKKYRDCLYVWEKSFQKIDDEIALILAFSALECGKEHLINGNLITATKYFKKSLEYTKETIYPTNDIRAKISLYSAISENVQSPMLEFEEEAYLYEANSAINTDLYNYIIGNHEHSYSNQIMKKHLKAKELIKSFHYSEATVILSDIEANRAREQVDSYLLFNIYSDLEYCAKELGNFEDAYKYSSKRIALLSAFKS